MWLFHVVVRSYRDGNYIKWKEKRDVRAEFVESYCFDYEINCLFDVLAARVAVVVS